MAAAMAAVTSAAAAAASSLVVTICERVVGGPERGCLRLGQDDEPDAFQGLLDRGLVRRSKKRFTSTAL